MKTVGFPRSAAARDLAAALGQLAHQRVVFLRHTDHRRQKAVLVDTSLAEQYLGAILDGKEREQHVGGSELLAHALRDVICFCENLSEIAGVDHGGPRAWRTMVRSSTPRTSTGQNNGYRPLQAPVARQKFTSGRDVGGAIDFECGRTRAARERQTWCRFFNLRGSSSIRSMDCRLPSRRAGGFGHCSTWRRQ